MKTIKNFYALFLPILLLLMLPLIAGHRPALAENPELSTAVFYVEWYDVGKAALEGLDGIKRIENGFQNFKEINTVYYEASKITIEEMQEVLRKAGTYLGTLKQDDTGE